MFLSGCAPVGEVQYIKQTPVGFPVIPPACVPPSLTYILRSRLNLNKHTLCRLCDLWCTLRLPAQTQCTNTRELCVSCLPPSSKRICLFHSLRLSPLTLSRQSVSKQPKSKVCKYCFFLAECATYIITLIPYNVTPTVKCFLCSFIIKPTNNGTDQQLTTTWDAAFFTRLQGRKRNLTSQNTQLLLSVTLHQRSETIFYYYFSDQLNCVLKLYYYYICTKT